MALIVAGEITITADGRRVTYRAGAVFHLDNGVQHEERYGPAGLYYLVGKDKTRPDRQRSREARTPAFQSGSRQAPAGHVPGPCSNLQDRCNRAMSDSR